MTARPAASAAPARHDYELPGWGRAELWTLGRLVVAHELDPFARDGASHRQARGAARGAAPGAAPRGGDASPPTGTLPPNPAQVCDAFVPDLCRRVHGLLAGVPDDFADVPLDDSWCTPFQRALLGVLRGVPAGEVVTYGELAALAGRPGAARAAGTFCARNRFWLFVPCHRVVSHDGIGGYGDAGVGLKRRLLELEGVALD